MRLNFYANVIIWSCVMAIVGDEGAKAADPVCVEEVAGVCLKFAPKASGNEARAKPAPSKGERAEANLDLSRDERRAIQQVLGFQAGYAGPVDGLFGPATRRAIAAWQSANASAATGYLSAADARALLVAHAVSTASARNQSDATASGGADEPLASQESALEPAEEQTKARPVRRLIALTPRSTVDVQLGSIADDAATLEYTATMDKGSITGRCEISLSEAYRCRLSGWYGTVITLSGEMPRMLVEWKHGSGGYRSEQVELW